MYLIGLTHQPYPSILDIGLRDINLNPNYDYFRVTVLHIHILNKYMFYKDKSPIPHCLFSSAVIKKIIENW